MISNSPECSSSHSYSPGFEGLATERREAGGSQLIMGPFVFQRLDFNDVDRNGADTFNILKTILE